MLRPLRLQLRPLLPFPSLLLSLYRNSLPLLIQVRYVHYSFCLSFLIIFLQAIVSPRLSATPAETMELSVDPYPAPSRQKRKSRRSASATDVANLVISKSVAETSSKAKSSSKSKTSKFRRSTKISPEFVLSDTPDDPAVPTLDIEDEDEVADSRPSKKRRSETVCLSYIDPLINIDLTSPSFRKLLSLPTSSRLINPYMQSASLSLPEKLPDTMSRISIRSDLSYGPHVQRSLQAQALNSESSDPSSSSDPHFNSKFVRKAYKGTPFYAFRYKVFHLSHIALHSPF